MFCGADVVLGAAEGALTLGKDVKECMKYELEKKGNQSKKAQRKYLVIGYLRCGTRL